MLYPLFHELSGPNVNECPIDTIINKRLLSILF